MTDLASLPWRTGRKLGRTVYARTGGEDWEADTVIGMMDTAELAEEACAAHNAGLARRQAQGGALPARGNSFANGPGLPPWLRSNWQYMMVREAQASIWDNLP